MNKESMSIRCAAAMESICLDVALVAKKLKVNTPEVKIKKHSNPEMRTMLTLEWLARLLRGWSGRKDEKPKPEEDKFNGILEGMIVRNRETQEYGKCTARYFVGSANGSVPMLKFSLMVAGHLVERKVESAQCEIMTDDMIAAAKKLAKKLADQEAKEQMEREKKAAALADKNAKQNALDETRKKARF